MTRRHMQDSNRARLELDKGRGGFVQGLFSCRWGASAGRTRVTRDEEGMRNTGGRNVTRYQRFEERSRQSKPLVGLIYQLVYPGSQHKGRIFLDASLELVSSCEVNCG